MSKNAYHLRHVKQSAEDAHNKLHRFRFVYGSREFYAFCFHGLTVLFPDAQGSVPKDVLCEVQDLIWERMDRPTLPWRQLTDAGSSPVLCRRAFAIT